MTAGPVRTIAVHDLDLAAKREVLAREWLVTNGLGGYASGTIGGVPTRRYHALLVAGLPPPFGRRVLLVDFEPEVTLADGRRGPLCAEDSGVLPAFRPRGGLPGWGFRPPGFGLGKPGVMPAG